GGEALEGNPVQVVYKGATPWTNQLDDLVALLKLATINKLWTASPAVFVSGVEALFGTVVTLLHGTSSAISKINVPIIGKVAEVLQQGANLVENLGAVVSAFLNEQLAVNPRASMPTFVQTSLHNILHKKLRMLLPLGTTAQQLLLGGNQFVTQLNLSPQE